MHINVYMHNILATKFVAYIINFRDLLAPNGEFLNEGDRLCQIQLAGTLEAIAEHGIGYFYDSSFTEEMVKELQQDYGSILTVEDFQKYSSVERPVVTAKFKNHTMLSIPPPACGATLGLILNMLDAGKIIILLTAQPLIMDPPCKEGIYQARFYFLARNIVSGLYI